MQQHKPINGWTKARMLEVIRARPLMMPAYDHTAGQCMYLTADGNKCGVGLFIPDGHPAQKSKHSVDGLLTISHAPHGEKSYSELANVLPLDLLGLIQMQSAHDNESATVCDSVASRPRPFGGNAKLALIDWVEKNVIDDPRQYRDDDEAIS